MATARKKTRKKKPKQSVLEKHGFSHRHGHMSQEQVERSESPGQTVKNAGLKSLSLLGEMSGMHTQTLDRWHSERPEAFDLLLIGAVVVQRIEKEGYVFRSRYDIEQALASLQDATETIKALTGAAKKHRRHY